MTGIQDVVFRIPEEWDAVWFNSMIQDLFRYSDIRNANGVGIGITGNSDTVATLSSTTLSEAYVVTQASSELTDERVLAGETGVIDITDGGPGNNVTVSVATNGIDFEKLQTVSTAIFAGRITAGTGDIEELTATQATSLLNAFTGDSGSGGLKGLVPAPSSGDAGKYLDGDGTFTTTNTAFNKNFGTSAGTVLEGNTSPSGIGAVPTSRTLTAGVGLTGGGDLTVDRTFDMANTAVTAGSYTTTNLTVDAQGRITAASNGTVTGILPLANGGTGSSTLTSGEVAQIENIGSATISGTQWGYLGALNQDLTTTSNVNFGNATFAGSVSKASGSFKIPHPLPELNETHNLVHSFVESPRAENLYSGMTNLVNGVASVNIDEHSGMTEGTFEALNTLLTHSSSNEGGYSPVKCSVVGNVITINCQDTASTDKVYWEVRGERKDAHMLDTEWTDDEGHVIVEPEIKIE